MLWLSRLGVSPGLAVLSVVYPAQEKLAPAREDPGPIILHSVSM